MSTAIAQWPKFLGKLKDREEVAEHTMAFRFEKPTNFKFIPGQFIDITLLNPSETDPEGNTRGFSTRAPPMRTSLWWPPIYGTRPSRECCEVFP